MRESAASFRDPAGACWVKGGRVLRIAKGASTPDFEGFLGQAAAQSFLERRQLVSTRRLTSSDLESLAAAPGWNEFSKAAQGGSVFEHEHIRFTSYPYEWPPEMLWEAGRLTLDLALAALQSGYELKDATPCNILYRGSEPVFVDIASFVLRRPDDPVWRAYGQFVRTFLLPLLANRRWGVPLADIYPAHRDGLEPEQVYRWCSVFERFSAQVFSLVSIPTWLRGKARASGQKLYEERSTGNPEKAQFIVESLIKQLQRSLKRLEPQPGKNSAWSNYMATHSYSEPAFAAKRAFVEDALARHKPARVLDVGANTGTFSIMAASAGAEVVAIDVDAACMGALWRQAGAKSLNILPLVVDLSRPSPALGWRNLECASFLDRAAGGFDCVLMLAVLHHFLVTERIPLDEVLRLASELSTSLAIIEFVAPDDEMFRHLTRGRGHLHEGLNQEAFEKACVPYYEIMTSLALPGTKRRLYMLKKGTSSR